MRWLVMKPSQTSRWACSELNSCSSPPSEDLRVTHARLFEPVVCTVRYYFLSKGGVSVGRNTAG